jgi:terminase small subunit-like protein
MADGQKPKVPVPYTPSVAARICELVAGGDSLVTVAATSGMPARNTIYRWLTLYPKFFEAYERAKEISAQSLEDEALDMARNLKAQNDFTGTKVQAYNIAMQQLRWSASRRDPKRYGQASQSNGPTSVPITITSSLNLGNLGPATDDQQSVFSVEIEIGANGPKSVGYDPSRDAIDITPEQGSSQTQDIDFDEALVDSEDSAFGVPEADTIDIHAPKKVGGQVGHKGRRGPNPKRHKSPAQAEATARKYAEAERKRLAKKTEE